MGIDLSAPAPLEATLRLTYGPAVQVLVRRLGRLTKARGGASGAG